MLSADKKTKNNQRTLLIIISIPLLMLLSSTALYYLADKELIHLGTANQGTLITPPLPLMSVLLTDQAGQSIHYRQLPPLWTLIIIGGQHCHETCERMLYLTRQTHTALGKQANQVRRLYLNTDHSVSDTFQALLDDQHPNLSVMHVDLDTLDPLFFNLEINLFQENRFFLVDPQGWVMMIYQIDDTRQVTLNKLGKDVLKDMKRLLQ